MASKYYYSSRVLWEREVEEHEAVAEGLDVLSRVSAHIQEASDILSEDKYGLMQTTTYEDMEPRIEVIRKKNQAQLDYARKIHDHVGEKEYHFYDKINGVMEELSLLDIQEYETKNTLGITETVRVYQQENSGSSMAYNPNTQAVEKNVTREKSKINIDDIQTKTDIMGLKAQFAAYVKLSEAESGKVLSVKEKKELQEAFNKNKLTTSFDHNRLADGFLEGLSTTLNFVPVVSGVKQAIEGCVGYTMDGEKLSSKERQQSIVFGTLGTALDVVTLGAMTAGKTAAKVSQIVAIESMTRITIGWTSQFASTKLIEMGMSSGEIFWVNLFGTLVASGVANRYVNKNIMNKDLGDDFLSGMSPEDAKKYLGWNKQVEAGIRMEDRIKINQWSFTPEADFYLKYKDVYDNPKFFDQSLGQAIYPKSDGFLNGVYKNEMLQPGKIIDRYGSNGNGRFFSPAGTTYGERALPPFMESQPYTQYEILKEFEVESGIIAPWFEQPGMGTQFFSNGSITVLDDITAQFIKVEATIENLLKYEFLKELK